MSQVDKNINNAPFSLIKYEAEIEISDNVDQYEKAKMQQKALDAKPSPQDILNNMILPRDWKSQSKKHFMQYVSHQKSERQDVVHLRQSLDQALEHRQARTEGICQIREGLFSQTFDQVIREVTINCPERGLLLMRVRDEHKLTLAAYQTLYQSSLSYNMRKMLQAEEGMQQLEDFLKEAEKQKQELLNKKVELECKRQFFKKKISQRLEEQREERKEQIDQINQQQNYLSLFLNSLKEGKNQ